MKYLVDATVLSEPTKAQPQVSVVQWLRDHEREIAVDPFILGELRFGILLLPAASAARASNVGLPPAYSGSNAFPGKPRRV